MWMFVRCLLTSHLSSSEVHALLTIGHALRLTTKVKLYLQTAFNQFHWKPLESADCSSDFLFSLLM